MAFWGARFVIIPSSVFPSLAHPATEEGRRRQRRFLSTESSPRTRDRGDADKEREGEGLTETRATASPAGLQAQNANQLTAGAAGGGFLSKQSRDAIIVRETHFIKHPAGVFTRSKFPVWPA